MANEFYANTYERVYIPASNNHDREASKKFSPDLSQMRRIVITPALFIYVEMDDKRTNEAIVASFHKKHKPLYVEK